MTRAAKQGLFLAFPLRSVSTESSAPCPRAAVGTLARDGGQSAASRDPSLRTGGESTSAPSGPVLLVEPGANPTHIHVHYWEPSHGAVARAAGLRASSRSPARQQSWVLPFLFGSGCTALGFAAYGNFSASASNGHGPGAGTATTNLSLNGSSGGGGASSWVRWPFRSTSTGAASRAAMLPAGEQHSVLLSSHSFEPPILPPPLPTPPMSLGAAAAFAASQQQQQGGGAIAAPVDAGGASNRHASSSGTSSSGSSHSSSWQQLAKSLQAVVGAAEGTLLPPPLPAATAGMSPPLTRGSISEAAARAAPAVVHLVVLDEQKQMLEQMTHGSGFIYDAGGYLLTNAHVVAPAQQPGNRLLVTLQDGRHFEGQVLCTDKSTDVAVVRISAGDEQLPAAQCGCSARLRSGEWVVALGSPLMLRHSVTAGIVSCVERRGGELGLPNNATSYIQTDAALSQGSSGGPLLDLDGQVVGMSSMKAVAADGVSFAIPIDSIRSIVQQFSTAGRVSRPFVGVTLVEVATSGLAALRGRLPALPEGVRAALVVQRVAEGSPAWAAGLQPDDVLLAVGGEQDLTLQQTVQQFGAHINKPLDVVVLRQQGGPGGQPLVLHKQITPGEARD